MNLIYRPLLVKYIESITLKLKRDMSFKEI